MDLYDKEKISTILRNIGKCSEMDQMARMETYETQQLWWTCGIHADIYHKDAGMCGVSWKV